MSSLPDDIRRDILVRLPVRSLARSRSVCKEWNSIISDPEFVADHLDRARKSLPPSMAIIVFEECRGYTITLDNAHDLKPISSKPLPIHSGDYTAISGYGLLCISRITGSVDLLNPATGESLTLPAPPSSSRSRDNVFNGFTGRNAFLGFHPVTKQYKVVNFFKDDMFSPPELGYDIYTVGSGSWRTIENIDFVPKNARHGVCIKGTIYWTTEHNRCIVASLDLATEESTLIPFPSIEIYGGDQPLSLGSLFELEGSIAMAATKLRGTRVSSCYKMDIWMLAGGQKKEWVKKYSVCFPCWPTRPISVYDGKVFLETSYVFDAVLSFVDLRTETWKEIHTHKDATEYFPFVESLTSLKNI